MMETTHNFPVTRSEFNRVLPLLTDIDGKPIPLDKLADELDAVGYFKTVNVDGSKIFIRYSYGRED